jgi:hypothetical protein
MYKTVKYRKVQKVAMSFQERATDGRALVATTINTLNRRKKARSSNAKHTLLLCHSKKGQKNRD